MVSKHKADMPLASTPRPGLGSQSMALSSTDIIDEDGDLLLVISAEDIEDQKLYKVSRHTMVLSSPVFKAMLGKDSRFAEGKRNRMGSSEGIESVTLEEESIIPLEIVLNVIHLRGNMIPKELTFVELQKMAVFVDKYDIRLSLGMWPAAWARPLYDGIERDCEEWLFVAVALQLQQPFAKATRNLAITTNLSGTGDLIRDGGTIMSNVPKAVLDDIASRRDAILDRLEKSIWAERANIVNSNFCKYELDCKQDGTEPDPDYDGVNECCWIQLGRLVCAFPDMQRPGSNESFRRGTVLSIRHIAKRLQIRESSYALTQSYRAYHENCNVGLVIETEYTAAMKSFIDLKLEDYS